MASVCVGFGIRGDSGIELPVLKLRVEDACVYIYIRTRICMCTYIHIYTYISFALSLFWGTVSTKDAAIGVHLIKLYRPT